MQRAGESVPGEDYKRLMMEGGDREDFTGEELQLRRMMPVRTEESREPVKFDTVYETGGDRRFVVLGKPGSGKSTLLKYLMLEEARVHLEHHRESGGRLFPILVEIRKFEYALSHVAKPDYNILDYLYDSMRRDYNLTLPEGFFERYLESGRALLLFDGLDEVAAEGRRAGVLVELAPGKYGFSHKTFQEYFAAQWIANEVILNFDLDKMIDYVDEFIGNAFWHETLLLALRALPNRQTQKVLGHILERDPKKMEPYFYHNYYFAMKFIAEQGRWLNDRDFVQTQIQNFFDFSWNDGKDRSYYDNYTWKRFTGWLSTVSDSLCVTILHELLLPAAEDKTASGYLRRDCAWAVGKLGFKDKAVEILIDLYLAQPDKYEIDAQWIYSSLWKLTAE